MLYGMIFEKKRKMKKWKLKLLFLQEMCWKRFGVCCFVGHDRLWSRTSSWSRQVVVDHLWLWAACVRTSLCWERVGHEGLVFGPAIVYSINELKEKGWI
jgi:hypothetical protein